MLNDLFMAGNKVVVDAPVAGTAYVAGRRLAVDAAVTGDLFAAGYGVVVPASVAPADRIRIEARKNYKEEDWAESMPVKVPLWRIPVAR